MASQTPLPNQDRKPDQGFIQVGVLTLLRRIPETWTEFDLDRLAEAESKALCLLVAAGMVERRGKFRLQLLNHEVAVEATFTATGEFGLVEVMEPLLAAMWEDWKNAFQALRSGELHSAPSSHCELLKPDEWRLTEQGMQARADLERGKGDVVVDFVLCQGIFDGRPRLAGTNGRTAKRLPVRGNGLLVSMRKLPIDLTVQSEVRVVNWEEGAKALAKAIQELPGFVSCEESCDGDRGQSGESAPDVNPQDHEVLAKGDFEVLTALSTAKTALLQIDIITRAGHTKKAARNALRRLLSRELIALPAGTQRKGYVITRKGRAMLGELQERDGST